MTMWISGSYAVDVLKAARAWQDARKEASHIMKLTPGLWEEAQRKLGAAEHALSAAIDKHRSVDS